MKTSEKLTLTVSERLSQKGYTHIKDKVTLADGRHSIFDVDGILIGRYTAKECCDIILNA